jgi:hypothetical protein
MCPESLRKAVANCLLLHAFMRTFSACFVASLALAAGCGIDGSPTEDGRDDSFVTDGKLDGFEASAAEADAVLRLVNAAALADLDVEIGLSTTASKNITALRMGADGQPFTADDDAVSTLAELDAVPYVGPATFAKLLDYVTANNLVGAAPPVPMMLEMIATGDRADFALDPDGKPITVVSKSGAFQLTLADGSTVALPSDVPADADPQIACDAFGRIHLFYPGADHTHRYATLQSGAWVEHEALPADQIQVDQGRGGQIYVLGGKQSQQIPGWSYLSISAVLHGGFLDFTALWQGEMTPQTYGLAIGSDNQPSFVFQRSGIIRESRPDGSGWSSRDLIAHGTSAIATTGGATPTVVTTSATDASDVRVYRPRDGALYSADVLALDDVPTSIDATTDAQGAAHVCVVAGGALTHFRFTADGTERVQSLGDGDQCSLAVDAVGSVHLFVRAGSAIRHGTLE